jgi:hypothetical protein
MSIDSGINQDVQAKMNAYRGNPKALAQQYSQSQQLIDLLALQKLKSEKEAAARDMQLKMGGQQMPTIAEARPKEVLDLTKQELAQNTAGAMKNTYDQEQRAVKDLVKRTAETPVPNFMMQGVAGLPANNMTAKAMATGGIVAFQSGGSSDPLAGVGGAGPEDMARDRERLERARQEEEERRAIRRAYDVQSGLITTAPPVSTAQAQAQDIESGQSQSAPRAPAPQQRQAAPQGQPGIAGLDPRAIAIRDEVAKYIGFSPEERARREKGMAELSALDAKRFDPDRRRSQSLTRWLLGGAGRTGIGSTLGGAGAAVENYNESMDAQERQALLGRQKQVDELIAADVGTRKSAFDLGLKSAIDYAQIAAKQAANALSRAGQDQAKYLAILNSTQGRYNDALREVNNVYANEVKSLNVLPGQALTPDQQSRIRNLEARRQLGIQEIETRLGPMMRQAEQGAGMPSSSGFTYLGQRPTP